MNFHKTIGFLAALLLTLGLGVPDSYAQDPTVSTVTFTLNGGTSLTGINEGGGATVVTVSVNVSTSASTTVSTTHDVAIAVTDASPQVGTFTPPLPSSVTVPVPADGTTGTEVTSIHAYTPPAEDDETGDQTFTLQASVGTVTDDVSVTITNSGGTTVSSVTIELNGEAAVTAMEGGDALAITVVADALVGADKMAGYSRDVVLDLTDGTDALAGEFSVEFPVTVTAAVTTATLGADTDPDTARVTTTITYTPAAEDKTETANNSATITAASGGQTSTAATVTETDINVIDDITVTFNGGATLAVEEDGAQLGVAVAVSVVVDVGVGDEGDTREVVVDVVADEDNPLAGTFSPALPITVTVTQGAAQTLTGSAVLTYTPAQDADTDDAMFTVEGSTAGQDDNEDRTAGTDINGVAVTVDDDDVVSSVALTINGGAALTVNESDGATDVTVSVTVTTLDTDEATTDYAVTVALAEGSTLAGTLALPITVPVTVTGNDGDDDPDTGTGSMVVSYTPPVDPDSDSPDPFSLEATVANGTSDAVEITVNDDSESVGDITITTSLSEIRENVRSRDVVVTASLSTAAPAGGVTVAVEAKVEGDSDVPTDVVTAEIVIAADNTEGSVTVSLDPSDDDTFTTRNIVVTGSAGAAGYNQGTAMIAVLDNDSSIGELTITAASPPSVTVDEATDVKLTVKGLIFDKTEDSGTVIATVKATAGTFTNTTNTNDADVTVAADGKSAQLTINMADHVDLVPDEDSPDGTNTIVLSLSAADAATAGTRITVTASADMYDAGSRVVTVANRGGLDIQGYRAVLSKPAANGWAIDANNQVFVDVMRVGSVAYPWSQFESIKVSVRDTAHDNTDLEAVPPVTPHEIDAVTASNFNLEDNGAVTFDESGSRGDVKWQGNDKIRFQIQIHKHGADDPAADGQYLGAYAHIEFTSGSITQSFTNRDSDQPVYPSNPTLVDEANRYRGDGKLFKVDNLPPSNAAIAAVNVSSGDEMNAGVTATVGDEIRVAVKVSGNVLFRDSGIRVMVRPVDGTGSYKGITYPANKVAPKNKNKVFTANQVIAASNDSLRHTFAVTEGFFTFGTDDYIEGIGKKGTIFQPDEARGEILVQVKDQAGNYSGAAFKKTFDIDSRSPSVRIRYPAADPDSIYDHTHPLRFTGHSVDDVYGYSEFLNPLVVEVDEDLLALKVLAVGSTDTLDISDQFSPSSVGDSTVTYDTSGLSSTKKDGEAGTEDDKYPGDYVLSSANVAGTDIELAVLATDQLGNTTKTTISGVTHDAAAPEIEEWFPQSDLLDDGQFNDATPPVFTLPEDVDSIAVRFTAGGGADVTKERGGVTTKGEDSIDFSGALTDETSYDMTIFVRDLAGNVYITPAGPSSGMRFNAEFDNPVATRYKIETETADMDSVIAGQANMLTIQAEDYDAGSDAARNALTYKNAARISAWDTDGGAAESVWFEGTGVTDDADNPDGVAMLSAADWRIGKRTVAVKSNKATGFIKILVQHLDSGMGDTAVVGFDSAIDSLYVGAADFAGFEITAWEEGVEGEAPEIWGDYTLRVVPTDRHGNPSVRAFKANFDDSLDVLDTRVKDSGAFEYKNGIDVEIIGVPAIEDFALLILSIEKEGATYDLVAPDNRRSQTVQIRVVNASLNEDDDRSQNIRSTAKFKISAPLEPVLTLWVPGSDVDEAGNDVVIPADPGDVTVTVAAAGFNAGDMVTFTRNGTAGDPVAADDDGVARLMITASVASTTTVSASNGVYSTDELTITFVDTPAEPTRKSFASSDGMPVYLVYSGDAPPDMTVGLDDFGAFGAAFGSSEGDENYNLQADIDGDGDVDLDDFGAFISSYGRTADGPATKPLVLLPGINENAEFSLSLGSERVVAGELVAVDVSLANVAALVSYGFALNYETDKFEFVSVAPADEDLLKSTGGETPLFYHVVADGQVEVANSIVNGTAVSGGGDIVRFVFRVLREFEDNARFEIANGLVFDPSQLQNPAVVAGVLELQSTPREFALHQNFPNPFNPDTTIKYDLAESADVTLQIYNVLGQVVRTLVASEAQNAGRYQIRWNGMDDRGVSVSSGIYFYQISADGKFSDVRKLMLLK